MSNLGEDAEGFFREGDDGTYEGGPASVSVLPFALGNEPDEEPSTQVTEARLERRRRFKRLVATIVGSLGAGLLLMFTWLLASSARATEGDRASAPAALPPTMARAEPARRATQPKPPRVTAQIVEATPPSLPAEATPAPVAPAPVASARTEYATRTISRSHALPKGRVAVVRASANFAAQGPHRPPTANFPD